MAPDGRLSGLALDPSVLQLDERVLARELMAAALSVNPPAER